MHLRVKLLTTVFVVFFSVFFLSFSPTVFFLLDLGRDDFRWVFFAYKLELIVRLLFINAIAVFRLSSFYQGEGKVGLFPLPKAAPNKKKVVGSCGKVLYKSQMDGIT